jgi:hypothetical protein
MSAWRCRRPVALGDRRNGPRLRWCASSDEVVVLLRGVGDRVCRGQSGIGGQLSFPIPDYPSPDGVRRRLAWLEFREFNGMRTREKETFILHP